MLMPEKNRKYAVKSNPTDFLEGIEDQKLTMRNWHEVVKTACWFKEDKCPCVVTQEIPESSDMALVVVAPSGNYVITFEYVEPPEPPLPDKPGKPEE